MHACKAAATLLSVAFTAAFVVVFGAVGGTLLWMVWNHAVPTWAVGPLTVTLWQAMALFGMSCGVGLAMCAPIVAGMGLDVHEIVARHEMREES